MKYLKERIGIRNILPLCHFLLSFFYERIFVQFHPDIDVVAAAARNQIISDTAERVVAYIISKLIAAVFIIAFWKIVFYVKDHIGKSRSVLVLCSVFTIGLVIQVLNWPLTFMASSDNLITYSYAIRLMPEYWHSLYSSCVLCACMMVFPHPVFMSLLQWLAAVSIMGYLLIRIEKSPVLKGKGKYCIFWMWLIPKSYTLLTDSYRTEVYALLCMFMMSVFIMDAIDGKKRSGIQLFLLSILCAFAAVWRTEGIILAVPLFFVMLVFGYREKFKYIVLHMAVLLLAFICIAAPQKIGDKKYYGKDYSFINSFTVLQNVLNAPDSNLTYEGAEDDLNAIGAVAPLDSIAAYGLDGYRRYNAANGRIDINQSMAPDSVGKAYNKAYYRLLMHNPIIYVKTQGSLILNAIGLISGPYQEKYRGEALEKYPPWTYDAWDIGSKDLLSAAGTTYWSNNLVHQYSYVYVMKAVDFIRRKMHSMKLDVLIVVLILGLTALTCIREIILLFRKRKVHFTIGLSAAVLLAQFCAIVLVMPAPYFVYMHACIFSMAILIHLNITRIVCEKRRTEADNDEK